MTNKKISIPEHMLRKIFIEGSYDTLDDFAQQFDIGLSKVKQLSSFEGWMEARDKYTKEQLDALNVKITPEAMKNLGETLRAGVVLGVKRMNDILSNPREKSTQYVGALKGLLGAGEKIIKHLDDSIRSVSKEELIDTVKKNVEPMKRAEGDMKMLAKFLEERNPDICAYCGQRKPDGEKKRKQLQTV